MAKPSNTIGDRDYGRRTYASRKKYEEQRKLASDAQMDRLAKRKHSEYKKPYVPDQSYPEMEMYNIPWNPPVWPRNPPDNPVTVTPVDPGGPIPPRKEPPPKELPPFLGCMFFSRRIRPTTLTPGQIAVGGVDIGSEDTIKAIHIFGPGILGSDITGCNEKTKSQFSGYKPQYSNKGFCVLTVRAKMDPTDFNHVTPYFTIGKDFPGPFPIIVEVIMASGAVCTEMLEVENCPADPALAWNWDTSAQSIAPGNSGLVAITGGRAPFTWAISGNGFSLPTPPSRGSSSLVTLTAQACGPCDITVTDACGDVVAGHLISTGGQWVGVEPDPHICVLPGALASYVNNSGNHVGWINITGKYKQTEQTIIYQGLSWPCSVNFPYGGDCNWIEEPTFPYTCYSGGCTTFYLCSPTYGCGDCLEGVVSGFLWDPWVAVDNHCKLRDPCVYGGWVARECNCVMDVTASVWSC